MLVTSISSGIYLSSGVVYFTRIAGISPAQLGVGLSIAGLAGVCGGVAAGRLSDRFGPRIVMWMTLSVAGVATLGFLAVREFAGFVVVVVVSTCGRAAAVVVTGPVINRIVVDGVGEFRAYIRSVFNVGVAVGATASVAVAHFDSIAAYGILIGSSAVCLFGAALLVRRLPVLRPSADGAGPSHWLVLRDRPYLALTAVDSVLSLQYRILNVIVPLWIMQCAQLPTWTAPSAFVLNTVIVVCFQVRVGRRVNTLVSAGVALRRAGWAFFVACTMLGLSAGESGLVGVLFVAAGVTALSVGELWQTAGGFEAANTLAPASAIGQYLGVFSVGLRMSDCIGPALLTWLCLGWKAPGWLVVGLLLLSAGAVAPLVIGWGASTRNRYLLSEARVDVRV
ncbi:MFS transporter [Nocardia acididurans]|uniref:MFS transporter n=1 Tax=Nocardia acididurans TaxID=2802282 RepID=UPI001E3D5012|nr:MFS transporter [Nocardia acididurans]